eukprot:TRINITY_DN468_c0_g1_i2.p1 TRINITY_DN468_c0_g1~~TRINITY_DN468_c0_g1_i2.p1  ORF type:complete len:315 (-),score=25.21 TRINITY_DN468_c0_g1_i2:172-990(-)
MATLRCNGLQLVSRGFTPAAPRASGVDLVGPQSFPAGAFPALKQVFKAAASATSLQTAIANDGSYTLPSWSSFEMGRYPVYWDTMNGRPPAAGESLTVHFNPAASNLTPDKEYGIGFNGGFNQPIMCGGEPRVMTRKDRGVNCQPLYTIQINVPIHALTIIFSFTDGKNWTDSIKLSLETPRKFKNKPASFFNEGLAKELSEDGACARAIFPDAVLFQDRCAVSGLYHEGGFKCELDLVPGCTDPENPFYNPLANFDDGSCPMYVSDDEKEK